jgi:hypothetical protein
VESFEILNLEVINNNQTPIPKNLISKFVEGMLKRLKFDIINKRVQCLFYVNFLEIVSNFEVNWKQSSQRDL